MIILTHNFDFYRAVASRLNIQNNSFIASKDKNQIWLLQKREYQGNIFRSWRYKLENEYPINKRIFIASIPFVRNLLEFTREDARSFLRLTSLLHMKKKTKTYKIAKIKSIYKDVWNLELKLNDNEKIYKIIMEEASAIMKEDKETMNLENKVTLSIAIRLLAEELMKNTIGHENCPSDMKNQTRELFNLFKEKFPEYNIIQSLEQVNLITPENIHLNSFMYEPILDMSDMHLKRLYLKRLLYNSVFDYSIY